MWASGFRGIALRIAGVLVISLLLPAVTLSLPRLSGALSSHEPSGMQQRLREAVDTASVIARAATIDDEVSDGLSGRWVRWSTSLGIAIERPPVVEGTNPGRFIRILAGYGPDMFRFAFPLRAPAELASDRTDAAHNDPINTLVEIGVIGLSAYFALGIAIAASVALLLRGARRTARLFAAAVAAGRGAAFVGRVVEQSFGIAKPGDMTVAWLLVGLAAAAPAGLGIVSALKSSTTEPSANQHATRPRRRSAWYSIPTVMAASSIAIALQLFVTWTKAINYLLADHAAAGTTAVFETDPARGLFQIEKAISLAPDVRDYHHRRLLMLQAVAEVDPVNRQTLLRGAADADATALQSNPMSIDSNLAAAYSAWRVAQDADPMMAVEALEGYERLAQLAPSNRLVQERLESLRSVVRVVPAGTGDR
jgi:hypothetical protein